MSTVPEMPTRPALADRMLDRSYPPAIRRDILPLTIARLCTNAAYRFAPPFLAVIARGLDVSLDELGIAVAVSEISGLSSPLLGHLVDRIRRRVAMVVGLAGVALGSILAAVATDRWVFAVGLVVLAQCKVLYDLGLNAWIADHVDYARRGRVVGIAETAWALGLLLGVSLLGVLAALTSWRAGFAGAAVAVAVSAVVIAARLRRDDPAPPRHAAPPRHDAASRTDGAAAVAAPAAGPSSTTLEPGPVWRRALRPVLGAGLLMATAQCIFVTFGSWLEDEFGFGSAQLAAVTFLLGGVELLASVTSARRTDVWGKERSVAAGAALMVPSLLALLVVHEHLVPALALLAIALIGFEFGIVSSLSMGTHIIPSAPGRGLGLMVGAGTASRAVVSIVGTRLYTDHGFRAPMLLGACLAALAAAVFAPTRRRPAVQPR